MALTSQELAAIAKLNSTTGGNYPGDAGGLGTDGHRVNFVPALQAVATVGQAAAREAGDAATAAASASAQAASLSGTSTTLAAISTGSKTLTTQSGKAFGPGTFLLLTSDANPTTHYILAQVTAYSGTSLTINVTSFAGSGSRADWTIRVAGGPGAQGIVGPAPTLAIGNVQTTGSASATITGSGGAYTLNLGLPASTVAGPAGAQILNGARDPAAGDGNNGDYWMQTANGTAGLLGDYWSKSAGAWTKLFNARGPAGSGSGDVTGPNGGVADGEVMLSNGTTGKGLKGSGTTFATLTASISGKFTLPVGGTAGQYINGLGALVAFPAIPAAQVSADWSASSGVAQILNKPAIPSTPEAVGAEPAGRLTGINTQTGTTYALALADAGKVVEANNAAMTITVPTNATVAFPINTRVDFCLLASGVLTFAAASGVTIRSVDGKLTIAKQYGMASLYKRAANEWLLEGRLA